MTRVSGTMCLSWADVSWVTDPQVFMASLPESIQRVSGEEAREMLAAVEAAASILLEGRAAELLLLRTSKSHTARLCQALTQKAGQEAKLRRYKSLCPPISMLMP